MNRATRNSAALALVSILLCVPASAEKPSCPAGVPIATFKLFARPIHGGPALPISVVNAITPGESLVYEPVREPGAPNAGAHAEITIILVPEDASKPPAILPARRATIATVWKVPIRVSAIGVVFGPNGINEKKLGDVLENDPSAVDRLAGYADQNSRVEALVHALASYEQSTPGQGNLQSVLNDFSSHYNVALPPLDRSKPADEQAASLLHALTPALSATASTPSRANLLQQAGGLATSVASLFFGSPVSLAIGGAAFVGTMHTALFPPMDFQSAFTQPRGASDLALCIAGRKPDAHGRLEFVWMLRLPDDDAPTVALANTAHVPIGWSSTIQLQCASVAQLKTLPRARDWRLVSATSSVAVPVPVTIVTGDTSDSMTLDLKRVPIAAGTYHLAATWDWTPLSVAGTVDVRPFANFSAVRLSPDSEDRLVAGTGPVPVTLTGADFEFLDRLALVSAGHPKKVTPLVFTLASDAQPGDRRTLETTIDTTSLPANGYQLAMTQHDGATHTVPIAVRPSDPTLAELPRRANMGEHQQRILLRGTHLERIDRITSADATWTVPPEPQREHDVMERAVEIQLGPNARAGERIAANLFVTDRHAPIAVDDAVEVVAARPTITSFEQSSAGRSDVALTPGELPVGVPVSFVIHATGLGARPSVRLLCGSGETESMTVGLGQNDGAATLAFAGEDRLFLSVDPGRVGRSGCLLNATVKNEATGVSDPYRLGRVVHLPRIARFTISSEKVGDSLYVGTLVGEGLEVIDKTGWNAATGAAVLGIATPVPDHPGQQTLRIAVPWPSPSPHAPLYIWLVGEQQARLTSATY